MSRAGPTAKTRYQKELIKPYVCAMAPKEISKVTGISTDKVKYLIRHHPDVLLPEQPTQKPPKEKMQQIQQSNTGEIWGDSPDDFFFPY